MLETLAPDAIWPRDRSGSTATRGQLALGLEEVSMIVPVPAGHAMMHAIRSAGIPGLGRMFILTLDLPRRFAT